MDSPIDVEEVRAKLRAMPRAEALKIAREAGVAQSTADKFRHRHIVELGGFKLAALANALRTHAPAEPQKWNGKERRKAR